MTILSDLIRQRQMHWHHHIHHQPHELPPECPPAGAQWSPDVEPWDRWRPLWPQNYSEEEKQAQLEAGTKLKEDIERTCNEKGKDFEIPEGVYRLKDSIVIGDTEDFTLYARNVELIVTENINSFRILGNKNFKCFGPLTLDADPFGIHQGDIVGLNREDCTIDVRIWDDYEVPTKGNRIEFFTQEGVMLPHGQDTVQNIEDLGDRTVRVKMSEGTWKQHSPETVDEILKIGNYLAIEGDGKGGLEMRENTNTLWEDITMCSHTLAWAMPERGDDVFIRWRGSRRRGTNRLAGGGYPLMTFIGGSYTLLDSEIGHNFDDITDINTETGFAFHQLAPNQFLAPSSILKEGTEIIMVDYRTMEPICECTITEVRDAEDAEGTKAEFKALAQKLNVVCSDDVKIAVVTIDQEIHGDFPELVYLWIKAAVCREMRFERNYLHDGLSAGINPKGANSVIIKDNIVERSAGLGIAVSFDPYWWEGNPSRNIEITGNTVRNCPYVPGNGQPAISVYSGGSFTGLPGPDGTGQLQSDMLIANNAVYTSGGPGIAVTNSKNIEIRDNVITDCNFSIKTQGSIWLNAVSEGTRVTGNIFVGYDASDQNAQIVTGEKTDYRAITVEGNRCANPEVPVPGLAWHFWPMTDSTVEFHDKEWHDNWHSYPCQNKETWEKDALCIFHFEGSRVRVLGGRAPWYGLADIWIDDQFQATVDFSGPNDFMLGSIFMSPVLNEGEHWLKILNKEEPGRETTDDKRGIAVFGFDVLPNGSGVCLS